MESISSDEQSFRILGAQVSQWPTSIIMNVPGFGLGLPVASDSISAVGR
jgi:hypothetical protein